MIRGPGGGGIRRAPPGGGGIGRPVTLRGGSGGGVVGFGCDRRGRRLGGRGRGGGRSTGRGSGAGAGRGASDGSGMTPVERTTRCAGAGATGSGASSPTTGRNRRDDLRLVGGDTDDRGCGLGCRLGLGLGRLARVLGSAAFSRPSSARPSSSPPSAARPRRSARAAAPRSRRGAARGPRADHRCSTSGSSRRSSGARTDRAQPDSRHRALVPARKPGSSWWPSFPTSRTSRSSRCCSLVSRADLPDRHCSPRPATPGRPNGA